MRVYRAANDDFIMQGYSFAEDREHAEAYLDNPNFGGSTMYVAEIPSGHKILDLTKDPFETLSRAIDRETDPSVGACMISQALQLAPAIMDWIAEAGYDWVRYYDDYPMGCITLTACSELAGETELSEI